jgi:glyoxylase-like metal-dependent hydrolase (beta-lactamase superfamily II)
LRRQIVTHCHPDHLGLSDWLEQETGAPLFISQGEYTTAHLIWGQIGSYGLAATLELFKAHGLDPAIGEAIALRGNAFKHSIPEIPRHFHRLLDGDQLTIGDRVWSVIAGFGHSPEHSSLYCEELRMLISGDMLLPRISTNVSVMSVDPEADPLGLFLDSIGRFKELPADTLVLPSHGLPFQGIHARVAQLEAHHRDRCEALVGACGVPKTAFDLIPVLFSRAVSDPHQIKFAMGEAIAHLNYLEKAKTLIRLSDNGIIRFASTEH